VDIQKTSYETYPTPPPPKKKKNSARNVLRPML
jgi:hypothetical protein